MTNRCVNCERDKDEDLGFFGFDERFRCFKCGTDGKATREDILALEMHEKYEKKKEIVLTGEIAINHYEARQIEGVVNRFFNRALEELNNGTNRN